MKLPTIDLTINGITYDNTFSSDVLIDRTDLDEEFCTQAEKFAYYGFLAEEAKNLYERKKTGLEQLYAVLDHEKRTAASAVQAQNAKFKYTEKMCENEVRSDPRYKSLLNDLHDAKLLAGQLDVASKAIAQRRDMLIQLGAHNRAGTVPSRILEAKSDHASDVVETQAKRRRR